jgi:Holliday junction resolvasome RuvABC endonuclease subunit
MRILGIDIGTKVGLAWNYQIGNGLETKSDLFNATTVRLATDKEITAQGKVRGDRRADVRISRLAKFLESVAKPDVVIFEDVQFSSTTMATQLWASYRAAIWLVFGHRADVLLECVPVPTLKKFATGSGGADKTGMERALRRQYPRANIEGLDDNAIDAIWLLLWAKINLARLVR